MKEHLIRHVAASTWNIDYNIIEHDKHEYFRRCNDEREQAFIQR